MIILGVSGVFGHDAAACLLVDGRLLAFAEEERFSRQKHAPVSFPIAATAYCLHEAGLNIDAIDVVAASWDPNLDLTAEYLANWLPRFLSHPLWGKHRPEQCFVSHHVAHAAAAAFFAGVERAAVLIVDGNGENVSSTIARFDNDGFTVLESYPISHSLGHFYKRAANYLGLGQHGEGRLMGLAAYGTPQSKVDIIHLHKDGYSIQLGAVDDLPAQERFACLSEEWDAFFQQNFGPPEYIDWSWNPESGQLHIEVPGVLARANIAASIQATLVEALVHLARRATTLAGMKSLILAGGVALNCGANGVIADSGIVEQLIFFPACHDSGGALGAAAWAARAAGDSWIKQGEGPYLGPRSSTTNAKKLLQRLGISFSELKDPFSDAANLIQQGQVIGWFRNRMEAGPRALGNRSILARPDDRKIAARVNRIKLRESWRPLGPSVTLDAAKQLFEQPIVSPYMLLFRRVRPPAHRVLEGVIHIDGTTRPQTVDPKSNQEFCSLLHRIGGLIGVPAVLNTSFNIGTEPIVCTPLDAIKAFFTSELDALVIEDLLIRKR